MQISALDSPKTANIDLKFGGLSLQVIEGKTEEDKVKIAINKVYDCLKTGKKKEQAFYIYPWELNTLTDIIVDIVSTNKLTE